MQHLSIPNVNPRSVPSVLSLALFGLFLSLAALPVAAQQLDCGGQPCVFVYRGSLPINGTDDTWVKEVEVADLNGDFVPDLYAVVKQPLARSLILNDSWIQRLPRIDAIFHGVAGFDFDSDPLAQGFDLRPISQSFPVSFLTVRGYDAEVIDLDRDGDLDILRPDTTGLLKVLWNNGGGVFDQVDDVFAKPSDDPNDACEINFGVFNPPSGPFTGGNYDDIDVADLDADGDMDFVVGQYEDCGANLVIENRWAQTSGSRQLQLGHSFPAYFTHSVAAGLVNSDNYADILLGHRPPSCGGGQQCRHPELFLTTGPVTFGAPTSFPGMSPGQPMTIADIVGVDEDLETFLIPEPGQPDINGDGLPDLVLGQFFASSFRIYHHTGSNTAPYTTATTCTPPCQAGDDYDVRYGDFDQDGQTDIVTVNINAGNGGDPLGQPFTLGSDIRFFTASSNGSFSESTADFVAPPQAGGNQHVGGIAVAAADLDRDGDLDLVMGGALQDNVATAALHVYENRTLVGTQTVDLAVEVSHVNEVVTMRLENRGTSDAKEVDLQVMWGSFQFDSIPLIGQLAGKCTFHPNRIMGDIEWYTCTYPSVAAGESIVVGSWQAAPAPRPGPFDPLGAFVSGRILASGSVDAVPANDKDGMDVQTVVTSSERSR